MMPAPVNSYYEIGWSGHAFGDQIAASVVVQTLTDNGIRCALNSPSIAHLVKCPQTTDKQFAGLTPIPHQLDRTLGVANPKYNFYTDLIEHFLKCKNINLKTQDINITLDHVPVVYKEIPSIHGVDVALVTKSGWWTPYRNWPYFNELKTLLKEKGISYIDLSKQKIQSFEFLNYVKKSTIYLGLDTGASHYASAFIKNKGFIIQSGYCSFEYWASIYNYKKIEYPVECSQVVGCWRRSGCEHNHKCMQQISPHHVFKTISPFLRQKPMKGALPNTKQK